MLLRIPKVLILLILSVSVLYSTLAIVRHNRFESGAFDLGIYDQAVWQYSRFDIPYNTIKERLILGDHLTLTLPLLAPLYWFWSDVRMILVFQAVWITLSAIPIFLICTLRKFDEWVSIGLAMLYVLFPGIQFAQNFDFHPVLIGVGLLPWIAYALEQSAKKWMWVAVILLLLTQENMGLALASLGLIYLFERKHRLTGVTFLIIGMIYSFTAIRFVSLLSPIGFEYTPVFPTSLPDFFWQLIDQPEKRQSWLMFFGWYSFLPILSPGAFGAVMLDLGQYFLTGPAFSRMWSPFAHHRAILAPFLMLGTIQVLTWMKKKNISYIRIIVAILLLSGIVQQYILHYPINKLTKPSYFVQDQWMKDMRALLQEVPVNVSVSAQHNLVPHLSHRNNIYLAWPKMHVADDQLCVSLKRNDSGDCWWLDLSKRSDYLVVDVRPNQWVTQILTSDVHFFEAIGNMEERGDLRLIKSIGTARLYAIMR